MHPYFDVPLPHVLAHRGLTWQAGVQAFDENTLEAFAAAIAAGATHIESDLQVTKDGVPILFHDATTDRVSTRHETIANMDFDDVAQITLRFGGRIPTLEAALLAFPHAKFNLDFKTAECVVPASRVIAACDAQERVLIASFSDRNRRAAQKLLPNSPSSAGMTTVALLYLLLALRLSPLARLLVRRINAVQIPVGSVGLKFANSSFIRRCRNIGLFVHFWTINKPSQMRRLLLLGASGLVTDRTDLAVTAAQSL